MFKTNNKVNPTVMFFDAGGRVLLFKVKQLFAPDCGSWVLYTFRGSSAMFILHSMRSMMSSQQGYPVKNIIDL